MEEKTLRTWRAMGPSGPMKTVAKTRAKAEANLRYRLSSECGMTRYAARSWDLSDLKEV